MSFSESHKDYSLIGLQECAEGIVADNVAKDEPSRSSVCIVVAGGGGNAIINLTSYYKKKEVVDNERYECHAGNIIAGVALRGEVVKLAQ